MKFTTTLLALAAVAAAASANPAVVPSDNIQGYEPYATGGVQITPLHATTIQDHLTYAPLCSEEPPSKTTHKHSLSHKTKHTSKHRKTKSHHKTKTGHPHKMKGTAKSCTKYVCPHAGSWCKAITARYNISLAEFHKWNPAVGKRCHKMAKHHSFCVAVASKDTGKVPKAVYESVDFASLGYKQG